MASRNWLGTAFGCATIIGLLAAASSGRPACAALQDVTAPADDVLASIGKKAGLLVLAESSVGRERVRKVPVGESITAANVEQWIAWVVKQLPPGSNYAKLYLPPPPDGKSWKGDDVVAFALAQAKLYGPVGAIHPEGTFEILSQKLPKEKAKPVVDGLNLKPVYIVTLGPGNFTGVWSTTFGIMRLRQSGRHVSGTYTYSDGVIDGYVTNGTLKLHWLERDTNGKGPGEFVLSEDGDSFSGIWAYDETVENTSSWTGKRLSRDPNARVNETPSGSDSSIYFNSLNGVIDSMSDQIYGSTILSIQNIGH